jgi:mono/diheme cytochrome c family protein
MIIKLRPALATLCLAAASATALAAQEVDPEFAVGREEYLAACAACHGENADGNGPIATMFKDPVPGLTRLSADNDGVFPTLAVFQIVDGRTAVRAHGNPMPVFGRRYQTEIAGDFGPYGGEQVVRARVLELVYYLQSIQE